MASDDKKVIEINIKDIINQKIAFIKNNDIFNEEEYASSNEGELLAYKEILIDIEGLKVSVFINKYINILNDINNTIDQNLVESSEEIEKLTGYNNAIVSVLTLLDPVYEYKIDSN